jgi:transcriptional regulator with XRE-family HTH domain
MKLGEYLIKNSLTDEEFAERIGLSKHAIRKYRSGARFPLKWVVLAIEKETKGKVAPDDWYR